MKREAACGRILPPSQQRSGPEVASALDWKDGLPTCAHAYLVPVVIEELLRVCPGRRSQVVDLGCGNGYVTAAIAGLGYEVVGVDISESGLAIARTRYPRIRFELASVYDPDLVARVRGPVHAVVALEVVEHLYHPRRLFEASCRLLPDGGTLIVSTPFHGYLKNLAIALVGGWDRHFEVELDGGHVKFFSKATLSRIAAEAGFRRVLFLGAGRIPWLWKSMVVSFEMRSHR